MAGSCRLRSCGSSFELLPSSISFKEGVGVGGSVGRVGYLEKKQRLRVFFLLFSIQKAELFFFLIYLRRNRVLYRMETEFLTIASLITQAAIS